MKYDSTSKHFNILEKKYTKHVFLTQFYEVYLTAIINILRNNDIILKIARAYIQINMVGVAFEKVINPFQLNLPFLFSLVTSQNQRLNVLLLLERVARMFSVKKICFVKFRKIHRKTPQAESFFNKVISCRPATLFKKRLWHRSSSANFTKFFKKLFYRTTVSCFCNTLLVTKQSKCSFFETQSNLKSAFN